MKRFRHMLAAAVVGVATATLVVLLRQKRGAPKKLDVEDIHRWEDEGGQVLARRQGSPTTATPVNPA